MKRLTLTKQHHNHYLAHLYEHMFCDQLVHYAYSHKIWQYLDYTLLGTTYYSGIVYVEIESFTKNGNLLIDMVQEFDCEITRSTIASAFSQIIAETNTSYDTNGYKQVSANLADFDSEEWSNLEQIKNINLGEKPKGSNLINFTNKKLPASSFDLTISLDEDYKQANHALMPLYRQIVRLLADNYNDELCYQLSLYAGESTYSNGEYITRIFIPNGHEDTLSPESIIVMLKKILNYIIADEVPAKLSQYIHAFIQNKSEYYGQPDTQLTAEDTGILMGRAGWLDIASKDNAIKILSNCKITLQAAGKKLNFPIIET